MSCRNYSILNYSIPLPSVSTYHYYVSHSCELRHPAVPKSYWLNTILVTAKYQPSRFLSYLIAIMFHPNNVEDEKVVNAENIISYRFTDQLQLRQALQLADSTHQDGNKYLALLGDTVIKLVLVKEGLRRHATRGK